MAKAKNISTPGIRQLKKHGIRFSLHRYRYEEKGGTGTVAKVFNIDEHMVIKTIIMEDPSGDPFIILMHGDKKVSEKSMARIMQVKKVAPCDPETAHKHTGYVVGGISPFGTKKRLKVHMEASIADLETIYINAGKRGVMVKISPDDLVVVLKPIPVNVAI